MPDLTFCYKKIKEILGPDYQEPFEVVKTVEEYRQYWKPKNIKTILLAESHVYTTLEDYEDKNEGLDSILPNYPKNYVRFIYCINYGINTRGQRTLKNKSGTPQFWKIFYSTQNWVESNKDFGVTKDFNGKLKILHQMKEKGIWLVDASICGLYIPGRPKPSAVKIKEALSCSWKNYVKYVIENSNPERMIVIGKMVWDSILPFLSPKLRSKTDWIYQPNAHLAGDGHIKNYQKLHQLCNLDKTKVKAAASFNQLKKQNLKIKNKSPDIGEEPKAIYKFTRLCFLAKKIEPLRMKESFRIICPEGNFQMTKEDFYREFQNVIQSRSYRERGIYHYPNPPRKAFPYLINSDDQKN